MSVDRLSNNKDGYTETAFVPPTSNSRSPSRRRQLKFPARSRWAVVPSAKFLDRKQEWARNRWCAGPSVFRLAATVALAVVMPVWLDHSQLRQARKGCVRATR